MWINQVIGLTFSLKKDACLSKLTDIFLFTYKTTMNFYEQATNFLKIH